jgi:uncharacterized protein YpbB
MLLLPLQQALVKTKLNLTSILRNSSRINYSRVNNHLPVNWVLFNAQKIKLTRIAATTVEIVLRAATAACRDSC